MGKIIIILIIFKYKVLVTSKHHKLTYVTLKFISGVPCIGVI